MCIPQSNRVMETALDTVLDTAPGMELDTVPGMVIAPRT